MDLMKLLRRRDCHLQFRYLFLLWITSYIRLSDSCSIRQRGAPKGSRSPPLATLPDSQQQTGNQTSQQFDCPATYQRWYCLNGATCFTVKIGDTILYSCRCALGYMGQRCEYKDLDQDYLPVRNRHMVRQATIAGVTTAVVLVVIIVIIAVTIYIRRRREAKQAGETTLSQEQLQRIPFGRALSRTDQYKTGQVSRQFSGSTGGSASRVLFSNPSNQSGSSQGPVRIPERQALLSPAPDRFGKAPRAAVSEMNLSDGDTNDSDDVRIVVHDTTRYVAHESPHPYSASESSIAPSAGAKRISNVT
ncbi:hypothetical protein RvY_01151 [Ramazzottius varieornatus]|uniref:EGF-like domain-containing protein n=1 Tax=Ramazzottius varieornatus TaxID=947166 RepID=A0A1D1UFA5_RAMVA|nr:hypothetical protein RvY_01151 [Ramazzottius varieornatus]